MFKLLRYFSLISLGAITAGTMALVFLNGHLAEKQMVELSENRNVELAQSLKNALWPDFDAYVTGVSERNGEALRARSETAQLLAAVKSLTANSAAVKVKFYNRTGLTVFSSEVSQIGEVEDRSNSPSFMAILNDSAPVSALSHRDQFNAFSGTIYDRYLVETYVPILSSNGAVEAVFELYSDVTPLVRHIEQGQTTQLLGLLLTFGLLYMALFLVVRHADRVLKRQYYTLLDNQQRINDKNETLEHAMTGVEDAQWVEMQGYLRELGLDS